MYWVLGISFLVGVGIMIFIIVLSYFLSKINAKLNEEILKAKDERMKTTQEMLDIIRYIKISAI
jgi:ABC-type bacteriocin/lantibiotic exporter with double-glycine peptidase domain